MAEKSEVKFKKIKWSEVWKEFEKFMYSKDYACPTCSQNLHQYPEWDAQQAKIEDIVNKQLETE